MPNRNINTDIWLDSEIIDDFSKNDTFLWLYILTSPKTFLCGVLKAPLSSIAFDTKLNKNEIIESIYNLENKFHKIKYNKENNEILILNWHKHNWTKSPKLVESIERTLKNIKTQEFTDYIEKIITEHKKPVR